MNNLLKEIRANFIRHPSELFTKDDIRFKLYNYHNPIAQKIIKGVEYRIAEGLIRNKKKTYLLFRNRFIIGEFSSVQEAKKQTNESKI